jgi:hypothetical protein
MSITINDQTNDISIKDGGAPTLGGVAVGGAFMAAAVSRGDLHLHDATMRLQRVINDRLIAVEAAREARAGG